MGRFRKFFTDHAAVFEGHAKEHMNLAKTEDVIAPTVEHELSHMNCFNEYLQMFEVRLDKERRTGRAILR